MSKIIKVSMDLEVTVHDFPGGQTGNTEQTVVRADRRRVRHDRERYAEETLQRAGTHNHGTERKQQVREHVGG